jgi:hypothetical protein
VLGGIGMLVTFIIILIAAFKNNIWWGLGSLFCGIPWLVFSIMNFAELKKAVPDIHWLRYSLFYRCSNGTLLRLGWHALSGMNFDPMQVTP